MLCKTDEIFKLRWECFKSQHVWPSSLHVAIFGLIMSHRGHWYQLQLLAICSKWDQWVVLSTSFSKSVEPKWDHSENRYPICSKIVALALFMASLIKMVTLVWKRFLLPEETVALHPAESDFYDPRYILHLSKVSCWLDATRLSSLYFTAKTWLLWIPKRQP